MSKYCEQKEVEGYLDRDLTESEKAIIDIIIESVSAYIDNHCGRTFTKEEATVKYYDGTGVDILFIDPVYSLTGFTLESIDEDGDVSTEYDINDDFELMPYNEFPKTQIKLRGGEFTKGIKRYRITADFGYEKIPASVRTATMVITGLILKNPDNFKSETIEGYRMDVAENLTPEIQRLLDALPVQVLI